MIETAARRSGPEQVAARGAVVRGLPVAVHRLLVAARWRANRQTRDRLTGRTSGDLQLAARVPVPGLAHPVDVYRAQDVLGRGWGFTHVPATGDATVVLRGRLPRTTLRDRELAAAWVSKLGEWVAAHREPDLLCSAVVIDQSSAIDERPTIRFQLTYRAAGPHGAKNPEAVAAEIGARIPRITSSLVRAGLGQTAPMTSRSLLSVVTDAYGHTGTTKVSRGHQPILTLEDVGHWDHVVHGGPASTTWVVSQATSPQCLTDVIPDLLEAAEAVPRLRIALVQEIPSPAWSEFDVDNWSGLSQEPSPATSEPSAAAAPLVALVTATAQDTRTLAAARAEVIGQLDGAARAWLRLLYGDQRAAFATGLPLGVIPTLHAAHPQLVLDPQPRPRR